MAGHDLLLPPATRLVHIGPHKTGTTTLQGALQGATTWLGRHGVVYVGADSPRAGQAVAAGRGRGRLAGQQAPSQPGWTELVAQVRAAGDRRVVVSSERFCNADDEVAQRIVGELGARRAHVVVTLRPLARIVPSQWQQYVQDGLRTPYHEWLEGMFLHSPYEKPTPSFWRRHRHDQLLRRWAATVGPENLTVVVVDGADPGMILRTFESLVGLPAGSLVPKDDVVNRSLTLGEVELVRFLNGELRRRGWSEPVHDRFLRRGAVRELKTSHRPAQDEPRLATPKWALDRAAEVGAETAAAIASLGVRFVGDVASLEEVQDAAPDGWPETPVLPSTAAAQAVLGAIAASGQTGTDARRAAEGRTLREVSTRELLDTVLDRGRASLRRRLRGIGRSPR